MLKIGILLGDDIGLEVVPEAVKVMKAAAAKVALDIQWQEFPIGRALETTAEERLIRELILQLKLGRVSRSYFAQKFGVNIDAQFDAQFTELKRRGLLTEHGDWLVLDRSALLKIDVILHAFFLPQHQNARYS